VSDTPRCDVLERELAEAQKDAERWKWMRKNWDSLDGHHDIWDCGCSPDDLDRAVDAAITESSQSDRTNEA